MSAVLGGTIVVRRSISLSMEVFKISRPIRIHVLFDALPLEEVPTGFTRVANKCALKYHLYFLHILIPYHGFMHATTDLCSLKTLEYVSTLKKKINSQFSVEEGALIPLVIFQI
jgi:hypothetical protein